MKTIGLIVNPIAGMGGKVGLKGTDGEDTLARARTLGASPESPRRAAEALRALCPVTERLSFLTAPGEMGEKVLRRLGEDPVVLEMEVGDRTFAHHTGEAAARMRARGVDLLLFAGGDGTARDVVAQVEDQVVCLGIPTGVKMHSAVFAVNPPRGGELAAEYLFGDAEHTRTAEVMDVDEQALGEGHLSATLFGYMTVPFRRGHVQGLKAGTPEESGTGRCWDGTCRNRISSITWGRDRAALSSLPWAARGSSSGGETSPSAPGWFAGSEESASS
jgi:predicted polyphosphate/ATP-dependent NAD kinase